MACAVGTTFKIESEGTTLKTADATNVDVCTATQILDRLHREFTEKYEPVPSGSATVPAGKTQISASLNVNPTFHLRNQPPVTTSDPPNRFYKIFTEKTDADQEYRSVVSAIMKGVNDPGESSYKTEPAKQSNFSTPASFKGIYGLINLNELLEKKIAVTIGKFSGSSMSTNTISDTDRYEMRNGIKTTFEEIAHRENQIYREKFLNIILIIVGIFLVSTQLVQKYFSFGGGGGGFGFGGGSLFSGFGLGTNSGLFSRFGGLGLGRSGRSRIGSSLFTNNPYSLSNR